MRFIRYLSEKRLIIPKIGFYINEEYIFNHYKNIFEIFKNSDFEIIFANKFSQKKYLSFIKKIKKNDWKYVFLKDVLYKYKYNILVTHAFFGGNQNNCLSLSEKFKKIINSVFIKIILKKKNYVVYQIKDQYFQKKLGEFNIRFPYGADVGDDKVGKFYETFDLCFCHGPRDSDFIYKKLKINTFQIGYPRYDNFFTSGPQEKYKFDNSNLDKTKKNILWIPTVSTEFSTIETFHENFNNLLSKFNIILRPHPLEIDKQYSRYNKNVSKIVKNSKFIIDKDPFRDLSLLYKMADIVVCDYGGSIFSSLYLKKRIILINHENVVYDTSVYTSTSMEIRKFISSYFINDFEHLLKNISDKYYWDNEDKMLEKARNFYFGNFKGDASKLVVKKLNSTNLNLK